MWEVKIIHATSLAELEADAQFLCDDGWEPVALTNVNSPVYASIVGMMLRRLKVLH